MSVASLFVSAGSDLTYFKKRKSIVFLNISHFAFCICFRLGMLSPGQAVKQAWVTYKKPHLLALGVQRSHYCKWNASPTGAALKLFKQLEKEGGEPWNIKAVVQEMSAEMHWKLHAAAVFDEEKAGVTSGSAYLSN